MSTRSGAAPRTGARATARPPCARGRQGGGPGVGMSGDVVSTVRGARSGVRSRPAHVRRGPDVGRRFVVIVWSQPLEVAAAAGAPGTRASVLRKASTKAQPRCEASALWAPLSGKSLETGTRHVGGSSFPRHSRVLGLVLPPPGRPPPAAGVSSWLVVTPTAPSGCVCLHFPRPRCPSELHLRGRMCGDETAARVCLSLTRGPNCRGLGPAVPATRLRSRIASASLGPSRSA